MSDDVEDVETVDGTEVDGTEDTGNASGDEWVKETVNVNEGIESNLELVRKELMQTRKSEVGKIGNELFRNGFLVRIGHDDDSRPVLHRHTSATMRELLGQRVTFFRPRQGNNGGLTEVEPPGSYAAMILDAPDVLDVPVVNRIVNAPIFGPGGELHTETGLLRDARAWYEPADAMTLAWPVPEEPSDEILAIARYWIGELFYDFPFVSNADRANAWAMMLEPYGRAMIDGPTPLYVVKSPMARTGKGKLVRAALLPYLGYEPSEHTAPGDEAEWRKQLMAFAVTGKSVFFLDNWPENQRLRSAALSSMLTSSTTEDRFLSRNDKVLRAEVRWVWVMTGNNPMLAQDLAGRSVPIGLDANVSRPQMRDGWRHPDLVAWVREHRGQLVWSALVIWRAYLARQRPKPGPGVPSIGSFEAWRDLMGGVLSVAGSGYISQPGTGDAEGTMVLGETVNFGDAFLGNYRDFQSDHSEYESDEECEAIERWWEKFGDRPVTGAELMSAEVPGMAGAGSIPTATTIGALLLGSDDDTEAKPRARATKLGTKLNALRDQIICGHKVVRDRTSAHGSKKRYRLRQVTE